MTAERGGDNMIVECNVDAADNFPDDEDIEFQVTMMIEKSESHPME